MSEFMSYKFVDSKGKLRDKVISTEPLRKAGKVSRFENTWFDGSSFGFTPTSKSDLLLVPDPSSYHWDPIRKMEGVFCFLNHPDGSTLDGDFRMQALRTQNQDNQTMGALFGVEPEFFLLANAEINVPFGEVEGWTSKGVEQYEYYGSLPPTDKTQHIRDEIVENLNNAGLNVESCHHEVAPGQAEISWRCDSLLRTADKMLLAKYIISATAVKHGARATFDPKPFEGLNGSGCHVHQSIPAMKDNNEVLEAYAQGLVDHYDDLVKVCNISKNSHRRLVPGFEAPTKENNGFGYCDRTKTIRLPAAGGRLEFRLPDPEMNPYVALSQMLTFGMEGVRSKTLL
jgi:glutamine synthetase